MFFAINWHMRSLPFLVFLWSPWCSTFKLSVLCYAFFLFLFCLCLVSNVSGLPIIDCPYDFL